MKISRKILASKYARAFLNLYFDALNDQHIASLTSLYEVLDKNRGVLCYLSLPNLMDSVKRDFLSKVCEGFVLPIYFHRLIAGLVEKNNIELLPLVVMAIIKEFWRRKHVIHFVVHSSHSLGTDEQAIIVNFLTLKTGAAMIQATFFLDESLICGIKMRSDGYIFEHSVARKLKEIEQLLLQRVQI